MDLHVETERPALAPSRSEGELSARFHQRVRLFAARRVRDMAAAEDIAQETLRRVIEALRADHVAHREALPAFVFSTARHVCLHWLRSAAREHLAFTRLEGEPATSGDETDALGSLISEERARAVRAALDRLSAEDHELLVMLFYKGVDANRMAARLDTTTAALRVRKHRALRRLAARLGEKE